MNTEPEYVSDEYLNNPGWPYVPPDRRRLMIRTLADMPEDLREQWETWLSRHQIDPMDVLVGFEIICDDENRTVRYVAAVKNQNGRAVVRDHDLVREVRVVQLEAPALPFPR